MPRARSLACVDCGRLASEYDHRDYSKPLHVEPVCGACNAKRGLAVCIDPRIVRAHVISGINHLGFNGKAKAKS